MKCWFGRLLTLTCLLFVTSTLHADPIQWSYSWTRSPLSVASDASGTGGISLTLGTGVPMTGDSDVTAVNLSTFSSALPGTTDHFTNSPFSLTLTLTDTASGSTGQTTFTGVFNGTLSPTSAQITATYDQSVHGLTIGSNIYSVSLGAFVPPGIPDSTTVGSIGAFVSVIAGTTNNGGGGDTINIGGGLSDGLGNSPGGGTVGVNDVPEPATLVLAAMATPAFGLMYWRRRQAAKVAAARGVSV
jgi:PEP-CTERM motif